MHSTTGVSYSYFDQHKSETTTNQSNQTVTFEEIFANLSIPADCVLLEFEEFIPWNNPENIISFQVEDIIRKIKQKIFVPILFLIGFTANIINMAVFYKQGLKERINVCLFALSLADGLNMAFNMVLFGEQLQSSFTTKEVYGPVMRFITNHNLLGFLAMIWISPVLSAIIASERCFCVMQPLRSQTVLKTSTMTAIVISVYIVIMSLFFVVSARFRVTCAFDPVSEESLFTIIPSEFYFRHQILIDYLDGFGFGGLLPGLVILVVIVTTIITADKLRQAATWRAETSSRKGSLSQRDIALTKMLVANSAFFIACVLPLCVFRLVFLAMPEMNTYRRHHNFYLAILWILTIISYINSSFNIVVYYSMGSRYRQTFWQLFRKADKTV